MAETITVKMNHSKETPGKHRYDAVDKDAVLQDIYIKKSAFNGDSVPSSVTVTVVAG